VAGVKGKSGGHNKKSPAIHVLHGTFRPSRHAAALALEQQREAEPDELPAAARRRTLAGLGPVARSVAGNLLDSFGDWTPAALVTLRAYALSCERLESLQTAADGTASGLHREIRANLQLLKALNLERT
jgi:hypothetical protein